MDYYKSSIPIIDDTPEGRAYAMPAKIDGVKVAYGYAPEFAVNDPHRAEMKSPPSEMKIWQESDWDALFDEQEATKSSLEHLFLPNGPDGAPAFVNLDQNGDGYCWDYSVGHAMMLDRLKQGQPLIRLNPHSSAAIIKGGRDEGGWCGLGAKFAREHGMAVEGTGPGQWPLHSRNLKYDTPECRKEMAKYKVLEDWVDLTQAVYDQNLTKLQIASCGFNAVPAPTDYNPWGHSVCMIRWVRTERGAWGPLILNSWKGWGRHGLGVLRWIPDGAVAFRVTTSSV